jgi:probable HAF family extracellular repeat protein
LPFEVGVYWPIGADTVVRLEGLGPYLRTRPTAISANGQVIVGYAVDDGGALHAARWDNGALTLLEPISGRDMAVACNDDASVIIGNSSLAADRLCYWTSGGTVANLLAPLSGDTGVVSLAFHRPVSADGHKIIGTSSPSYTGVLYTDGSPASLGSDYSLTGISSDGSTVVGQQVSGGNLSGYWNGSWHQMNYVVFTTGMGETYGITSDNAVIYAVVQDFHFPICYFDSLATTNSSIWGTVYGVLHEVPVNDIPGHTFQAGAEDANVIAGYYVRSGPAVPEKWVAGVRTDLPLGVGWNSGIPCQWAISGDGQVIGGNMDTGGAAIEAGYWKVVGGTDTVHALPDLYPSLMLGSNLIGVSRDGSVAFGTTYAPDAPSAPSPSCTALYSLDTIPPWPP